MRNRYLLGAGVALAVALSWANAQAQLFGPGPAALYFGIEGGWTNLEDQNSTIGPTHFRQRFDDGFNVGARAG